MGNIVYLIIQLLSGAVGGNVAGALLKKYSMGTVLNSILGIVGGGLGAQLLNALGVNVSGSGADVSSIVGSVLGGGVGGGILMTIIGIIGQALKKK